MVRETNFSFCLKHCAMYQGEAPASPVFSGTRFVTKFSLAVGRTCPRGAVEIRAATCLMGTAEN